MVPPEGLKEYIFLNDFLYLTSISIEKAVLKAVPAAAYI